MSGTQIRARLQVSAEIRAAAAAARQEAARHRVRRVERRAAQARAEGSGAAGESERVLVARTRLAVLRDEAGEARDEEVVRGLETVQSALSAVRGEQDVAAVERALAATEAAVDLTVERAAVHREVVQRVAAALPASLRFDAASVRPAVSGGVRVEALRPTGGRLGIELDVAPSSGQGVVTFEVEEAGLQPQAAVGDACAVELAAVEQLKPHLAAAGLHTGELQRPDAAALAARRRRAQGREIGGTA